MLWYHSLQPLFSGAHPISKRTCTWQLFLIIVWKRYRKRKIKSPPLPIGSPERGTPFFSGIFFCFSSGISFHLFSDTLMQHNNFNSVCKYCPTASQACETGFCYLQTRLKLLERLQRTRKKMKTQKASRKLN